jgi:hypothetical protein
MLLGASMLSVLGGGIGVQQPKIRQGAFQLPRGQKCEIMSAANALEMSVEFGWPGGARFESHVPVTSWSTVEWLQATEAGNFM